MGILRRLFGSSDTDTATTTAEPATAPTPADSTTDNPVTLRLSRRGKPWVRDDRYGGGKVEVTGYRFVEADTGRIADNVDRREWLGRHGAVICYAAGVTHLDGDLLQSDGLQPSRRLTLVRDAEHEHDANAVSITLDDGSHAGWVPSRDAATVAPRLDAGERLDCVVVDQTRDSSGLRVAYSVLIGGPALIDDLFARARRWSE